ncbi:MAG: class B sortase [Bacilli bacterium]|nr:class B sortase [Bacilli bacterium]
MKKKINKYLLVFYIVSIILLIYSGYLIVDWFIDNNQNKKAKNHVIEITNITKITKDRYPYIQIDYSNLLIENPETIGWIQVPNTNINYPVVQSIDNEYYLNHNFYKKYNLAGWPFLDYRNTPNNDYNTIIYGHNRLDESMFGTLKKLLKEDYHNTNKYIFFNTLTTMNTYEIFSVYTINANDFKANINFNDDSEYEDYLNNIKSQSTINLKSTVSAKDRIITLYTCSDNTNDRTIVHAKLIQTKKLDK